MSYAHVVVGPDQLWQTWAPEPVLLAAAAVAGLAYGRGARALRAVGAGARSLPRRRVVAFYAGLVVGTASITSPLGALSETLFSAHMIQHLLLMLLAAPLLVYGAPATVVPMALPRGPRVALHRPAWGIRRARRILCSALVVGTLYAAAMWAWHLPALYEWALRNEGAHTFEHAAFLSAAALFWWAVLEPSRRIGFGAALLLTFATMLQSAALGALLTLASQPLYDAHAAGAEAWGLTLLQDQQLAGALMWVPPGIVYVSTMAVLLGRWLKHAERRTARAEVRSVTAGATKP
ncbi:MAG: cytochrome c oxidase assembly protein [Actinomycetota bacterium]